MGTWTGKFVCSLRFLDVISRKKSLEKPDLKGMGSRIGPIRDSCAFVRLPGETKDNGETGVNVGGSPPFQDREG